MKIPEFEGFSQKTVDFMWGIRFNNEKSWFLEHKGEYEAHLLAPTRALGHHVYEGLQAKLPREPLMLKVSRIYRDARRLFGRGPYKDHLWWCIRTGDEDWQGRPTFYFEIAPEYYSYGLGFWSPAPALMEVHRRHIQEHPQELTKLVRQFNRQSTFTLQGEEYARSRGETTELLRPWFQKKSLSLSFDHPLDERIFSPSLAEEVLHDLSSLLPFYHYFNKLLSMLPRD